MKLVHISPGASIRMSSTLADTSLLWRRTVVIALLLGEVSPAQVAAASLSHAARSSSSSAAQSVQQGTSPLERVVSLDLRNVRLEAALEEIDRQAHLGLAYTARIVPLDKRVTVKLDSVSAGQALEVVLRGTGVTVTPTATGSVMLERPTPNKPTSLRDQEGSMWGRVFDSATTQPLEGAVIGVKGTSLSAVTNAAGGFLFVHVPAGVQTVTARHLGYAQSEREVAIIDSQSVHVEFLLRMGMSRLQEVVTTATGKQRRLELGNDITVINADSIVATQPIANVTQLLEGRVPGLVVQHTSGAPGDPARLRLRGASSAFLNNDPIVIVDGTRVYAAQSDQRSGNLANSGFAAPSPLDEIDPHSIETIEVFKGPSAATLYGADAASGVIVITTKKGKAGPPRWIASVDRGVTYMPSAYPEMYLRLGHVPWNNTPIPCPISNSLSGEAATCIADSVVRFQTLNNPRLTVLDQGLRTAATVGVSGGSDALQYSVSGSYDNEVGLVRLPGIEQQRYRTLDGGLDPPDWMQRPQQLKQWGASSRLTAKLGEQADVSLTAMLSRTDQQRSSLETQIGSLMGTYVDQATGTYYRSQGTILFPANSIVNDYYTRVSDDAMNSTNAVNLNWRPRSWLTASADMGLNFIQRQDEVLLPRGAPVLTQDSVGNAVSGRGSSLVSTVNVRTTATAPLPWGFHLQAAMGGNYTDQRTADLSVSGTNLSSGSTSVGQAGHITGVSELHQEQATFGWYIEPSISQKRFWLSTGLRLDGGSTFGSHASLASFPKVSASYLISDEPFFPFKSLFNTLRLRAAYGHAGVQPGPGDHLRLFRSTSEWNDGQLVPGATLQTLGNTQLKPERSTELEGGFDADLGGDRVSLGVTGYRKTRVDALMSVPLPPSVYGDGPSVLENVGTIRNTGYELTLGTQIVRSDVVSWSAQLQVSHNQNVVVSLGAGVLPFGDANNRVVPGYPLFGRWALPVLGYKDLNTDGVIQSGEVLYGDTAVYLGSSEPNYTAGLTTTLGFFRSALTVSAGFIYENGLTQVGQFTDLAVISRGLNDPTASLGEQAGIASSAHTSFLNAQTVSTLRFNSLSVAYNLPTAMAQRIGARALSVALQGTNLGLHTNYRGLDPNVNSLSTGNQVIDGGALPMPRTWQVRVNASY
jgi:TonB-linked SusC/RagA family outer membrane protein